ncbi:hypothetical protein C8Q80DRAFT_93083 [Daedaleopsis nitida]|nr:hypothetical protein C8Q80DRAFT_93083 [Daedaleopsis nitida]
MISYDINTSRLCLPRSLLSHLALHRIGLRSCRVVPSRAQEEDRKRYASQTNRARSETSAEQARTMICIVYLRARQMMVPASGGGFARLPVSIKRMHYAYGASRVPSTRNIQYIQRLSQNRGDRNDMARRNRCVSG